MISQAHHQKSHCTSGPIISWIFHWFPNLQILTSPLAFSLVHSTRMSRAQLTLIMNCIHFSWTLMNIQCIYIFISENTTACCYIGPPWVAHLQCHLNWKIFGLERLYWNMHKGAVSVRAIYWNIGEYALTTISLYQIYFKLLSLCTYYELVKFSYLRGGKLVYVVCIWYNVSKLIKRWCECEN